MSILIFCPVQIIMTHPLLENYLDPLNYYAPKLQGVEVKSGKSLSSKFGRN